MRFLHGSKSMKNRENSVASQRLNESKSVLITGGARGLGLILAEKYAARGYRVAVCSRSAEDLRVAEHKIERAYTESRRVSSGASPTAENITDSAESHSVAHSRGKNRPLKNDLNNDLNNDFDLSKVFSEEEGEVSGEGDGAATSSQSQSSQSQSSHLRKSVLTFQCDVSDADAVRKMVAEISKSFGSIDILVNCAGVILSAPLQSTTREDFADAIDSNFWGMKIGRAHV